MRSQDVQQLQSHGWDFEMLDTIADRISRAAPRVVGCEYDMTEIFINLVREVVVAASAACDGDGGIDQVA